MTLPLNTPETLLRAATEGHSAQTGSPGLRDLLEAIDRCVLGRTLCLALPESPPLVLEAKGRKLLRVLCAPEAGAALLDQTFDDTPKTRQTIVTALEAVMQANPGAIAAKPLSSALTGGVPAAALLALLPDNPQEQTIQIEAICLNGAPWQGGNHASHDFSNIIRKAETAMAAATWLAPEESLLLGAQGSAAILVFHQGASAAILTAKGGHPLEADAQAIAALLS